MNDQNECSWNLKRLIHDCRCISEVYRIPPEPVILHVLVAASALAGEMITYRPSGSGVIKANFAALHLTPDGTSHGWMDREQQLILQQWQYVAEIQIPNLVPRIKKRDLQRRLVALEALSGRSDLEVQFLSAFLERVKYERKLRPLLPVGTQRPPILKKHRQGYTLLLRRGEELLTLVRGRRTKTSWWSLLAKGDGSYQGIVGRIDLKTFLQVSKRLNEQDLRRLGWIIECPGGNSLPPETVEPANLTNRLYGQLEKLRFMKSIPAFDPSVDDVELLNLQTGNLGLRLDMLPDSQRIAAVPDLNLAWHLSAILSAICAAGQGNASRDFTQQCTCVGVSLAEYVVQHHLYRFRRNFPADRYQPLSGLELRMFRLLPDVPCSLRDIQRRFRGLNKEACLTILGKLVGLGLAHQCEEGRFQKAPPPSPSLRLSDFLSVFKQ